MNSIKLPFPEDDFTRGVAKAVYEAGDVTGIPWDYVLQERSALRYGKEMRRARAAISATTESLNARVLGYMVLDKETRQANWSDELYTTPMEAIENMTGRSQFYCREMDEKAAREGRTPWHEVFIIGPVLAPHGEEVR